MRRINFDVIIIYNTMECCVEKKLAEEDCELVECGNNVAECGENVARSHSVTHSHPAQTPLGGLISPRTPTRAYGVSSALFLFVPRVGNVVSALSQFLPFLAAFQSSERFQRSSGTLLSSIQRQYFITDYSDSAIINVI